MAKSGFNFSEYSKWARNLAKTDASIEVWLKQFLLEQAQRVVREAKLRTPVDTGALRASYQIGDQQIALSYSVDEDGKEHFSLDTENSQIEDISLVDDNLTVLIWNPQEYASYVEYGHHSYSGRYMLTIAVDNVMKAMPNRFKSQFEKFLKSKGVI